LPLPNCNPGVSICIPCYSDPVGLKKTVDSLFACRDMLKHGSFHLVVGLNDCSFQKTDILSKEMLASRLRPKFYRTRRFLEYDESIKFLVSKVKTEFCIFIGCGELVLPSLFDALLEFPKMKVDFGVIPVCSPKARNSARAKFPKPCWERAIPGVFNKVLSGHVFRTSSLRFIQEPRPFCAMQWAHVEMALTVQGNSSTISMIYSMPEIIRIDNGEGWWTQPDIYQQYITYCDLLVVYNHRFKKLTYVVDELRKAYSIRLALMILQARKNNLKEVPLFFSNWIKKNCRWVVWRFVLRIALMMPKAVASILMAMANWLLRKLN